MKKQFYTGLNIQYPISQLILSGQKTIETRTYPLPAEYVGKDLLLVETPGKTGKFKARIVAVIRFSKCYKYSNAKEFSRDFHLHCVTPKSPWAWKAGLPKWAWQIEMVTVLPIAKPLTKRGGIKFSKNLEI